MSLNRVLLVDDDPITNYIHRLVLSETGITANIEIAETVEKALSLIQHGGNEPCESPDLIFLDLNLPGLSGWDFISEYRKLKDSQGANSIIVVLTTSANPDDKQRANQLGEVAEFRSKPMTNQMVEEIMQRYFQLR
jgi:CheY-like chemotaxis protein